jgi:Tol biopolymer transport system component
MNWAAAGTLLAFIGLAACSPVVPSGSLTAPTGTPPATVGPSAPASSVPTASPASIASLPPLEPARGLVAFLRNRAGRSEAPDTDIFFVRADGTGLRNFTNDALVQNEPYWLLDGSRLVFPVTDPTINPFLARLVSVLPDGTDQRDLGPVAAIYEPGARSPDGRFVAWGHRLEGLTILDLKAGTARQLSPGIPLGTALDPMWSPDGRWLAARVVGDGDEGVLVIDVETGDRIGFIRAHDVQALIGWAEDGRIVLEGEGPDYAASPRSGEVTRVVDEPVVSPSFVQVSPDGQWLADVQRSSGGIHFDLYVAPATGGEAIRPTDQTVFPASAYCWSLDSSHLVLGASTAAFPNQKRSIWLVSVRGDEVRLTDEHRDAFPACRPQA